MEIFLQEVILAVEPLLTAVHICKGGISNISITELSNCQKTLTHVPEKSEISLIVKLSSFFFHFNRHPLFFRKTAFSQCDSSEHHLPRKQICSRGGGHIGTFS